MSGPPDDTTVTTVADLVRKYGTRTIGMAVEKFVLMAPEFDGDGQLARLLGVMMADLQTALEDAQRRTHGMSLTDVRARAERLITAEETRDEDPTELLVERLVGCLEDMLAVTS